MSYWIERAANRSITVKNDEGHTWIFTFKKGYGVGDFLNREIEWKGCKEPDKDKASAQTKDAEVLAVAEAKREGLLSEWRTVLR